MKKSRLLVSLLALSMVVSLCGCTINVSLGGEKGENSIEIGTPEKTPEVQEPIVTPEVQEPVVTPEVQEPVVTPEQDSDLTIPVQTPEKEEPIITDVQISNDWRDLEFIFDGVKYKINETSYADLKAAGWTFDLADYGYENGYILNPRDKTYGTIDLKHSKYGDEYDAFYITVGFINNDTVAKDITECDIWSISMDTRYGFRMKESYSDMTVAKGIHFGSSEADVIAAFGTPDDTYENAENGYKSLSWCYDYSTYLKITVYADGGVSKIELQQY